MKTFIKLSLVVAIMFFSTSIKAQTFGNVQNSIPRDKEGINQFDVIPPYRISTTDYCRTYKADPDDLFNAILMLEDWHAGQLFEIDGVPWNLAKEAFTLAAAKLPLDTRIVRRLGDTD